MWAAQIDLSGTHVRLEPLSPDHASDLRDASGDGESHKFWYAMFPRS